MTVNKEVADFAIRDPLETPMKLFIPKDASPQQQLMVKALEAIVPLEKRAEGKLPAICGRASEKRCVIDGTAEHCCEVCGELVWTSPSTIRVMHNSFLVCVPCITSKMQELKERK